MSSFLRRCSWALNLAFLLLAALLAARTVNTLVHTSLAPLPEFSQPPPAPDIEPRPPVKSALSRDGLARLMGIALPTESKSGEPTEAPAVDFENQIAAKTTLPLRLLGTIVANQEEWSLANLEDGSNSGKVYMVGDLVAGATILAIERMRVIIDNNGRKEYVDGVPGTGQAGIVPSGPPVASLGPAPGSLGSGIRPTGEHSYEVPREEIDRALNNPNELLLGARMTPAFKDGVISGFKLSGIRAGSLFTRVGIQNGDIIRRINGFELNSVEKGLELYAKLRQAGRIEIELERQGSLQRKTYSIR